MEEKQRFVSLAGTGKFTVTELCAEFKVSRKTGHKWLRRYRAEGAAGLRERSRRPRGCAHQTAAQIERWILQERRRHPTWGPKKLRVLLRREHGVRQPPAVSTIAGVLRRHGLSQRVRRRPGVYDLPRQALTRPTHPNHVWTVDFKGWFTLGNGARCDPLTVCDLFSHYYLACRARPNQQFGGTLRAFKKLMRHRGLPKIIRVDNGTPFASLALGRLSQLSVWWINQGIAVEFIRPASPQQNGSHERGHRDLKAETTQPPSPTFSAQQRRFDRWQHERNHVRPHEALGQLCPAQIYRRSPRRLGENDRAVRYPKGWLVRTVSRSGLLWHEGHNYYLGEVFAGCCVGLRVDPAGRTELHFANRHLGYLHYDPAERFRPAASIVPPDHKPLATTPPITKPKV
ncbi:MAG: helix-turn-helix domain-containing protein [Verrucomicrobia bacterium]|nr:helix-turn-helix domain-containing protein [Verrucomicrobiota bacterium]